MICNANRAAYSGIKSGVIFVCFILVACKPVEGQSYAIGADPGQQSIPAAWEGKSHDQLVEAVYDYTLSTMIAFRKAGVFPEMVQVGNEISHGMLWPDGKLPDHWDNFTDLVQAGINGVQASCGNNPCPEIMIHIDKGGNKEFTKFWFDKFHSYGIK